jgi:hypothetical protein
VTSTNLKMHGSPSNSTVEPWDFTKRLCIRLRTL